MNFTHTTTYFINNVNEFHSHHNLLHNNVNEFHSHHPITTCGKSHCSARLPTLNEFHHTLPTSMNFIHTTPLQPAEDCTAVPGSPLLHTSFTPCNYPYHLLTIKKTCTVELIKKEFHLHNYHNNYSSILPYTRRNIHVIFTQRTKCTMHKVLYRYTKR